MLKYHYVYEIVNSKENKSYIGSRTTKKVPELDTQYWSSSDLVKALVKEHPEDFIKIILCKFTTRKRAVAFEIFLHNYFDVARNPAYYNKAKQTSTKFDTTGLPGLSGEANGMFGRRHRPETIEKMMGRPGRKGQHWSEEERINQINARLGKKHTEEHNLKIALAGIGRTHSEETKKKMSESQLGELNHRYGKHDSFDIKIKLSDILDLHNNGYNHTQIANILGCDRSNVSQRLKHYRIYGKQDI